MHDTGIKDKATRLRSEKETEEVLIKSGRKVIPRLNRGKDLIKRTGLTLQITEPLYKAFRLWECPECKAKAPEKFIIFEYVAVCLLCNQFYFITR